MMVVRAREMRELDRLTIENGTPGSVLMERAGLGATEMLVETFPEAMAGHVVVVAGKGNNGGDGLVMARALRKRKASVEVLLLGASDQVDGDAAAALRRYRRGRGRLLEVTGEEDLETIAERLAGATLIVDAMFGTGLNAPVTGWRADAIAMINAAGVPVFSVDIPSGLHADSGQVQGVAVQAEATATFAFPKLGQVIEPGLDHIGTLAVVDIGIDPAAIAEVAPCTQLLDVEACSVLVPRRPRAAHKGTAGHALLFAGSRGHSGAALMASRACCRAGAGLTTLAGPAALNDVFAAGGTPEVMTGLLADDGRQFRFKATEARALGDGKDAIAVGPGLGTHRDVAKLLRWLLAQTAVPLVFDADALTCLASDLDMLQDARSRVVVTPHPGEMARLMACSVAEVQADRIGFAGRFATEHACVVLLKGRRSIVATPDGQVYINPTGNPGMASGGMGDVLTGVIVALLAQGLTPVDAACLAAYLHGAVADRLAEDRGRVGFLASDVIEGLPSGMSALVDSAEVLA